MWQTDGGDEHFCLLRSSDDGNIWVEIGDADDLFGAGIGAYDGTQAMIVATWLPEENTLIWVGLQTQVGNTQACRIRFTDDNGGTWCNKMGNWTTALGAQWSGATSSPTDNIVGNVGCTPLPKVGVNE